MRRSPFPVSRATILCLSLVSLTGIAAVGCDKGAGGGGETVEPETKVDPRVAEAKAFVQEVDGKLRALYSAAELAAWDNATDITDEHAAQEAAATEELLAYEATAVKKAQSYDGVEVDAETRRQLELLKRSALMPAPNDEAKRKELTEITTRMSGAYGKGKYCKTNRKGKETCRDLGELSDVLALSREEKELLDAWEGWRTVSPPLKQDYARFVELGNEGATELGYSDMGEIWRSGYDMSPDDFEVEIERLWNQVRPLYEQLHCHVRAKLRRKYGKDSVPKDGMIPAHLLGNMWAQEWGNVYPLMEPHRGQPSIDVTKALGEKGFDEVKMVKAAENFFVSLGLDKLPDTFWERSMFKQPEGRDVVCHASAWDPTYDGDLRIKMCIKVNQEDLVTIHHELGHNYYYMYYKTLPFLYQQGANDGFHEGIGDTLALSVTPAYLKEIGLLDEVSDDPKAVLNKQMQDALDKIAFLPFGLMVDKWRWQVFSGQVTPDHYNEAWWELRRKYQGIDAPVARTEEDFDPGAKYHIPANTPYMRYFLARILQFQFHKALCDAAGHEGPLHTCSIYNSKEAGQKLSAMLAMGASQPWPDALEAITGSREMDAGPMLEYFAPLSAYLDEQNAKRSCGWDPEQRLVSGE